MKKASSLRLALGKRVVIADGAMGTMIQSANPSLDDFQGLEGCNEVLNITRPELIADIHRQYFSAGVDAVETNTFGANLANLGEYDIPERIYELAEAGARIARGVADEFTISSGEPKWVLGSLGPGTKLPTLGHTTYEDLRAAYQEASRGLIDGGSDALLIETTQDLLQAKAAVNGARAAVDNCDKDILIIAQVTVLIGGCCGTTPEHLAAVVRKVHGTALKERAFTDEAGASSLYQFVPFRQQNTYLAIGERTNANGSRAFRDALLSEDWQKCVDIAKDQVREGAHMLDLSVDYVGRDGVKDMRELASRFATATTLPIVLDSTEPAVIKAGLESLGGRCVINSVNYEDGDGPDSRFARIMPIAREHGAALIALTIDEEGQARTAEWKLRVARRLIKDLNEKWGIKTCDIIIDCLTFPIATGQEETRKDGLETINAIAQLKKEFPQVQTTLGISNVSFGLNPAARIVLNSVFLAEAVKAGLDSAIVHPSKISPIARIPEEQREVALDLIYDRRKFEGDDCVYDPLSKLLELFAGVEVTSTRQSRAAELAALPIEKRLVRRIIDGEKAGLEVDLDQARLGGLTPLAIINDYLLEGMKEVGELFGRGEMQLPFVLQSAEVMKSAVALLEPHMEKSDASDRGSILLATVKGDVHDIGKNLVDIILTNNGYRVVNIGIKQTINQIIDAAQESSVDVIGMSGLLVKSTVIMKENLEELRSRGLAEKWPVILGGAALTRSFVEKDLAEEFPGTVRYARDAFEGLALMDTMMGVKKGVAGVSLPPLKERRTRVTSIDAPLTTDTTRSDVASDNQVPKVPFFGSRVVKGIALADYSSMLDERALYVGQWGLKSERGKYEEMVENQGRPRLRSLLNEAVSQGWINAAVVYGYF
ncbi:MAG: methionine synthase, partial [Actinobacteria bacterium]|nr:methionine synthase [Actinomycetota bacterium]